jgi:hypothetical protein
LLDAVTLDHHLAGVGVFAGRIEDPDVGEDDAIQAAGSLSIIFLLARDSLRSLG